MDRAVDPTTLDFVDAARGAFAYDDDLAFKLGLTFTTRLGSWEGDPAIGNELHLLERGTFTDDWQQRTEGYIRAACQWLIDAGEVDHVDVTVQRLSRTALAFEVDAYAVGADKGVTYGPITIPVGAA